MKKFLVFIFVLMLLFSSGCDILIEVLEEATRVQDESDSLNTSEPQIESNVTENNDASEVTYENIPTLPNIDFSDLDLFEDGYQTVAFDYAPDGDTAIFLVGSSALKTRFLGVDTKEMKTDSGIPEPWAQQAKDFTNHMLKNANEIILELDDNSDAFDDYDRLLAWIWIDGQLLNYMLAEKGFADVKYLYDDYRYNDYLLDAKYLAQSRQLGIWSDDEPYYNPNDDFVQTENSDESITIGQARDLSEGSKVKITGLVTNNISNNVFIEDETGGIYVYTNKKKFSALTVGNQVIIEGQLKEYNGLLEIVNFTGTDIRIVSQNNPITPKAIALSQIGESLEGQYIQVNDVEITFVDYKQGEKGYSIFVEQNSSTSEIRIDKHLTSYPDAELFTVGDKISVVGNISQHYDAYQIVISGEDAIMFP